MVIRTPLKKKDFEKILEDYYIGKYKKSRHVKWALGNTVYIIDTTKGKFVLKIFEGSSIGFIKYQIKIMDFLANEKIPIPIIIKTRNKKSLLIHKNKRILIQKFVEGKSPKKLSDKLIKDLAKKIGMMNKSLLKLKLKGKSWEEDHEFKPLNQKVNKIGNFNFKEEENILMNDLREINRKKLRKGIVHGDCHTVNLLISNEKLKAIIDWDDVHKNYLIYEISTFIVHSFIKEKRVKKKQIKLFLKEYQKQIKLNSEERKAIYYFIKQRLLGIIEWHIKQMKIHKDLIKKLKNSQNSQINWYNTFNKISLEEFLEFFKK